MMLLKATKYNVLDNLTKCFVALAADRNGARIPLRIQTRNSTLMTADEGYNRSNRISHAMSLYLKRLANQDKAYNEHVTEYELGKRYLARMMGLTDSDLIDEANLEKCLRYLFPSGLFERDARPIMKHPSQIFYSFKEAQFDSDSRPFNYLFYTLKPQFYSIMHDLGSLLESLKYREVISDRKNEDFTNDVVEKISSTQWLSIDRLKELCLENLNENDYKRFVALGDRILENRLRQLSEDDVSLIMKYRTNKLAISCVQDVKEPLVDEQGNLYQVAKASKKRTSVEVRVSRGCGRVIVESPHFHTSDILYFVRLIHREYLMMPFVVTDSLGQFDVRLNLAGDGSSSPNKQQYRPTCEAVAARQAIAMALTSFLDADMVEKLRLAGLLTDDIRLKERKMYGRRGARKRHKRRKR